MCHTRPNQLLNDGTSDRNWVEANRFFEKLLNFQGHPRVPLFLLRFGFVLANEKGRAN
jgi:hypothetical protein